MVSVGGEDRPIRVKATTATRPTTTAPPTPQANAVQKAGGIESSLDSRVEVELGRLRVTCICGFAAGRVCIAWPRG
jgi:hypothetical protein